MKSTFRFIAVKKRPGKQMTRNAGEAVGKGKLSSVLVRLQSCLATKVISEWGLKKLTMETPDDPDVPSWP